MATNAAPRQGDVYLSFNGLDNYVEIPSTADYSVATTGELAVAAWIRPDTLNFSRWERTGYVHWFGKGEGVENRGHRSRALLDACEGFGGVEARRGKLFLERAVDPRPRIRHRVSGHLMGNAAGTVERDDGAHDDASRGVEADADTPQHSNSSSVTPMAAPRPARSSLARSKTILSQPIARSRFTAKSPPTDPPMTIARG
jgi:hypothetical protein